MRPNGSQSMLDAVRILRVWVPDANLTDILTFLCVCENEGASVKELAFFGGTSAATVSRSINFLARSSESDGAARHRPLLRTCSDPHDGRRGAVFLTPDGRQLKCSIQLLYSAPLPEPAPA